MLQSCLRSPPDRARLQQAILYIRALQLTVQYKLWNESPISLFPASDRQMLFELEVRRGYDQHFRDIRQRTLWPDAVTDEREGQLKWCVDLLQHDAQSALLFAREFGLELDAFRQEQVRLLYLRYNDSQAQAVLKNIDNKHEVGKKMLTVARLRLCSLVLFVEDKSELKHLTGLVPPDTLRWIHRNTKGEEETLQGLAMLITSPEIAVLHLKATRILLVDIGECVTGRSDEAKQVTAMADICKEMLSHMQNM